MDDKNNTPADDETLVTGDKTETSVPTPPETPQQPENNGSYDDEMMTDRLERLGGEPAPVITPEEFARLQQEGRVNIDSRGRVRTTRRSDSDAGVSLRKRRAWYG